MNELEMDVMQHKVVVISHASIKQINRAVYRKLKDHFPEMYIVIPASLVLGSGQFITAEPTLPADPAIVPMELSGRNPRTYYYPQLIAYLSRIQPCIVLLENDPVSRLGLQLSAWCKKNSARLVCQTYENIKRDVKTTLASQGWTALLKNLAIDLLNVRMAKRVDALLVVNKSSELIFKAYGYRNVWMIPLGYDRAVFFPDQASRRAYRDKINVSGDTVLIAYFGRLVRQKGVHLLIEALRDLKAVNWMLLIDHIHDSESTYASSIGNLIKEYGLEDRVIYFEADHFEIANYMRASDIMVAPSITTASFKEQYGRAVQEAMACGCVCIVSDSGHLKDLVGLPSLVFKESDVRMLKNMILRFIEDPEECGRIKTSLIERASLCLTTDSQAEALRELLRKLLDNTTSIV